MWIAPSLLAADAACFAEEVRQVERAGAEMLHIDVMDGHFVPNLSFGPQIVSALRKQTSLYFDVHLMVTNPSAHAKAFIAAGANAITAHAECGEDELAAVYAACRERNVGFGVALCPETPVRCVRGWLSQLSLLLIMSIRPGFGGQSFLPETYLRIAEARMLCDVLNVGCRISVDGGVNGDNAAQCRETGADILVAGSAIFGAADRAGAIAALRREETFECE